MALPPVPPQYPGLPSLALRAMNKVRARRVSNSHINTESLQTRLRISAKQRIDHSIEDGWSFGNAGWYGHLLRDVSVDVGIV